MIPVEDRNLERGKDLIRLKVELVVVVDEGLQGWERKKGGFRWKKRKIQISHFMFVVFTFSG